ncbi:MAG: hypothetical protein [Caudoviricetes sp.]|nr:MAG: hypothetical protein [Caudoviricetes sp.]
MSLPTGALFFKDSTEVARVYINCGWAYDEVETLRQIKQYLESNPLDYDSFTVYGKSYSLSVDEIDSKITELRESVREHMKRIREEREKLDPNDSVMQLVRRRTPSIIAEEIIGVQPMNDNLIPTYENLK